MVEKTYKRGDGRAPDELRPIEAKVGIIKRANGSAMFSFGNSKAIAAVYGPRQLYPQHLQNPEKCLLRCYYDMTSFSVSERKKPGPSRRSAEISFVTTKALEPVLQLEAYPNSVIDVYIMIIQADASTRCAGINAAAMALANAGLPMTELVSAVSIGKIGEHIVADLTKEEEDYSIVKDGKKIKAATDIPMAFLSRSGKISLLQLDGKIKFEELKEAIALGKKVCKKIAEIQTEAIKKIK
ncbi:MAG: exosome complex exonuclease Rrp41 [Candidatus Pacearchaeota archaeon]